MNEKIETPNDVTNLFDAHCHLQDAAFDLDREEMIAMSQEAGVSHFLVPATDAASFGPTLDIAGAHEHVFCALGIHPHSASEWNSEIRRQIRDAVVGNQKIVAIGEIGLDYHYDFSPRDVQRQAFSEQIELAIELGKPIVIHTRESEEDVFRIVEEHYASAPAELPRGQFHCFSAGVEWMEKAISLGFYVSFTGNITFKNSNLADVVRKTPLDRMLLETDSPYLAPAPNRGKRNSPAMLPFIARKVCDLKELDISIIMQQTFSNACSLFKIPAGSFERSLGSLLLALGLLLGASNLYAQQPTQPAGTVSPDSILTGERRKAEELRKKQEAELAHEAELHRQDSIKAAQQAQLDAQAKAREQVRQDSIRAAEQQTEAELHAAFLQTPLAWRAIGLGGNLGVASVHTAVIGQLEPTSVLGYSVQLKTEVTRRLDITASFTHSELSFNSPQDSLWNYGNGTPIEPSAYNPAKNFNPPPGVTWLVQSESLGISVIGIDLNYVITKPTALIRFYFGIGYQHYMMKSIQNYLQMKDSTTAYPSIHTYEQDWNRNGIDLLFGLKNEIELGNGLTLEPYGEISATGLFNGPTQFSNFIFQPDLTDLIGVNVRVGITLYYGWWGVPRQE
jgi:TatD DNase family protein